MEREREILAEKVQAAERALQDTGNKKYVDLISYKNHSKFFYNETGLSKLNWLIIIICPSHRKGALWRGTNKIFKKVGLKKVIVIIIGKRKLNDFFLPLFINLLKIL